MALTLLFGWALSGIRQDMSSDPFLPSDSPAKQLNERFKDDFGHDMYSLVLVTGDVFSMDYLRRLRALHDDVAAIDVEVPTLGKRKRTPGQSPPATSARATDDAFGDFDDFGDEGGWGDERGGSIFEEVTSLVNVRQTVGTDSGIRVDPLLEPFPTPAELPALKKKVLADRAILGRLVGPGARHSVIVARTDHMDDQDSPIVASALREVAARHSTEGFQVRVGGIPSMIAYFTVVVVEDTALLFSISLLVMIVILSFVFRHPLGVLGPVVAVTQSAIWAMGASALLDRPMTQVSTIVPAFLICVGIGDAVHIQSAYRGQLRMGKRGHDAVVGAVATTGMPVLMTTLTTAVGLMSFQLADAVGIKDMGLQGSFGVLVAMVQCLTIVPIFLSWNTRSQFGPAGEPGREPRDLFGAVLRACNAASSSRRRTALVLLGAVAFTGINLYGASRIYVSHDDLRSLPADAEVRQVFETINEEVGGNGDLILYLQSHTGKTLADRELMLALEKVEAHIEAYRDPKTGERVVTNITGVLDVVRETNRALHAGNADSYRVPDSQRAVQDIFTVFQNSGPDELRRLATVDLTRGSMVVRTTWIDSRRFVPLKEHIQRGVDEHIGGIARVELTGTGNLFIDVTNSTIRNLVRSFSIAFIAITLFMALLLRSVKLGLMAMVPNLVPIIGVLGLMGFANIWMDYSNVLIASIALGIVVDDTIHFLHQFRARQLATGDTEQGLQHAFDHSGRAMIITSLTLIGGFAIFVLGRLGNVVLFGVLTDVTVALALAIDLIMAPALLRALFRSAAPEPGNAPTTKGVTA